MKWKYKISLPNVNPQLIHHTQMYIDSEIIRRSDPRVPFKTGNLKRSGILGTRIGTGVIQYTAPYAKIQYLNGRSNGQRDRKWTRRTWISDGKTILRNAQKIINGGR